METLEEFVERLSAEVSCYYHPCGSGIFSLKKVNTDIWGEQQVFAWVQERKRTDRFRVDTYRNLAEIAGVSELADGEKPRLNWNQWGVFFYVNKGSIDEDYQKAVKALKAILPLI